MTPWSIHPPSIAPARTPTMGNGSRSGKCVPPRRHKKKPRRWRSGAERISSRNQAAIKPTSAEVFEPDLGDAADHRGQRFHLGDGGDDVFFLRLVGQHDDVGARLVIGRLLLQHGVDRDGGVGQDARQVGQHARLVGHVHAQIVAGGDLRHRQDLDVGHLVRLEGQVRHAVLRIGRGQARDVDQVGDDGRRGRLGAGALAVVQRGADGVALHQHRVHRPFDVGDQALGRDQRRMHAQFDALGAVDGGTLGDAQQFDAVAQLLGVADVDGVEFRDAFHIGFVELHRDAEGDGRHDGGLVRGVDALDVEGRIGFRVTQLLRLFQRRVEVQALVAHLGQDEIGGAVDDPGQPLDAVGRQALAQRLDDGDAAGHRRLEGHHHALFLGGGEDLVAMHGQQRLVGGDDMLAVGDGLQHQFARQLVAADQLHDDVDVRVVDDLEGVVNDPDIDIVVELIGGYELARELVLQAIANGKHVVTANKALLAVHGNEIFAAAQEKGVMVAFEAAVAGGIPIIKALREGLTANRIEWLAGIINGTTNFILSEMRDKGLDFDTALKQAQELGYAEADPTFDIEGVDAAHKATIMSAIAFGIPVQFDKAYVEGISKLNAIDIRYAEQLGYRIKLLGITKRATVNGVEGIELRVHPTLIPAKRLIANVEGAMNAVLVHGDAVGATLYYGKGAGAEPTASAVIADLVDITRLATADPEHRVPHLAFQPNEMTNIEILPMSEITTSYYLRMHVADQPGVLADLTRILADATISIDAMLQKEPADNETRTDIIMLTHQTQEKNVVAAIAKMEALATVVGSVTKIRLENLS